MAEADKSREKAAEEGHRSDGSSLSSLPDAELVTRAQGGETHAFDVLAERYADKVHRLTYRVLRNEEDAQDALQEAFLSAYRNLGRFEGKSTFSTWLYRVAMNAALMKRRKRREGMVSLEEPRDREEGQITLQLADWGRGPIEETLNDELRDALELAVQSLPEDLAQVFLLREVEGMSNAEASEILELSVPAVKSRLHRARVALRDYLNRFFADRAARERSSTDHAPRSLD
ncbi:MAG TPA: sigma-70 family RNA polymerase sigma factor [Candidatus Eisenbacteria bacterium]|jgi:RNA polymerase sigma-70 factor (ECF subfamily)|nr:sigma-70 family RNA polymerase sigma factor [Candidatus Eisenbacteria bacterium]